MTLKKKMTKTEFRQRANEILMRLSLEVTPFWPENEEQQQKRLKRAAADPLYFCRTYLPHYFSHAPAPFHYELVAMLEERPQGAGPEVDGRPDPAPSEVAVPAVAAAPPGVRQDHGVHLRLRAAADLLRAPPLHHHRQRHRRPGLGPHRLPLPGAAL